MWDCKTRNKFIIIGVTAEGMHVSLIYEMRSDYVILNSPGWFASLAPLHTTRQILSKWMWIRVGRGHRRRASHT